jgi:hypothetical protein
MFIDARRWVSMLLGDCSTQDSINQEEEDPNLVVIFVGSWWALLGLYRSSLEVGGNYVHMENPVWRI